MHKRLGAISQKKKNCLKEEETSPESDPSVTELRQIVRRAKAAAVSCLESVWFGLLEPRTTESFNEGFFFSPPPLYLQMFGSLDGQTE